MTSVPLRDPSSPHPPGPAIGRARAVSPTWEEGQYVLQFGNIAGWPYLYARALRDLGIPSINVIPRRADFRNLRRELPHDRALLPGDAGKLASLRKKLSFIREAQSRARLVHYHGGSILRTLDARLFRRREIPLIATFGGSDVRLIGQARQVNPYFYRGPDEAHDRRVRRALSRFGSVVRFAATDPELAQYAAPFFERVFLLRQPVDLDAIEARPPGPSAKRLRVLHIPTDPVVKGTRHVLEAFGGLKAEGAPFEPVLLEPRYTQQEMRQVLASVDIVVDELCIGAHGVLAVEAMAAGKALLAYVRDDLVSRYPAELPIVNVNPDTLLNRLRDLVHDPRRCAELGRAGRAYVERYHSLAVIGPELLAIYREIGLTGV